MARWAAAILVVALLGGVAAAQEAAPPIRVVIVRDGASEVVDRATDAIRSELEELLAVPVSVRVEDGDWTLQGATAALAAAEDAADADAVIGVGALTARAAAQAAALPHPTVLALSAPSRAEGLLADDTRPWADRAGLMRIDEDLARLAGMMPVRRVALLIDESEMAGLPDLADAYTDAAAAAGVTLVPVPVPAPPAAPLSALPDDADVDAAILGLLLQSSDERRWALIDAAAQRHLPVVAGLEADDVTHGALLTTLPERAWLLRGRHVALAVQALLQGTEASTLRGPLLLNDRFALNLETARALGLSPPFSLISQAEVVSAAPSTEAAALTLADLVVDVVARNPGLQADAQVVVQGASQVDRTRAALLPQLGVEARGTWIDADRAAGPTPPAERTLQWSATLTQSLYSASALGAHSAERDTQAARQDTYSSQRLDLVLAAAVGYIELLRDITTVHIQQENLQRVRANLALAQVRAGVGAEGRAEIYRWQIELAQSQQEVVRGEAARQQAEISLNRLRDRPLDSPLVPRETGVGDLAMVATDPRLNAYLEDPASLDVLVGFAAQRAADASPELRALDARIRAAETNVEALQRRLYVPDLSLEAGLTDRLLQGGAGTEGGVTIPGFTIPDDWDWSVGLVARLPLVAGGGRYADLDGARAALAELEAQRRDLAVSVEGQVRTSLQAASASHQAIALTAQAADAAEENLALVRDAYERGSSDLIQLVDAQSQSLVTALARADADFQFLQDFLAVERAMGQMSFGPDAEPADAFFGDLEAYAARQTSTPAEEP